MRYDALLEPISEDDPCGPDLSATYDEDFELYYFEAIEKVPTRFVVNSDTGEVFDRKSIDIKAEVKTIGKLLERSRDLRLLSLEAQFQALSGTMGGFSECLQIMAALMEKYWIEVNPKIEGGDASERRTQLELLDELSSVIMPIEHMPLFRDRRIDTVTYRDYQIATGAKDPRANETPGDAGAISVALQSADNAEAVDKLYADLTGATTAIESIINACRLADSAAFSPGMDNLKSLLTEMTKFVADARPDLAGDGAAEEGEGTAEEGADGAPSGAAPSTPALTGAIKSHTEARAALLAVEHYFLRFEPSAPALILVRQAQELIGKPLTEALDVLLPGMSENARIDFGSESGFLMDVNRMRILAGAQSEESSDAPYGPIEPMEAETRDQASGLISAVESFFRQTEPSSPVPILLFKAKTYMNRDFSAIISDLFQHIENP
ncbi:type VI secretion system ImpA family N-terminal domain-containing protein [Alphaproteobacteria bacterium KMM 3653]|uniref:Type VI secretion system ImpA family N-terminal domain-containing protein n=1 Tax=Harenicola maris TaxID=2841044 RepID=A0AAP2G3I9_9RHOB|nr:type VI secretion system ImpA family N-terminal domain-containing protein [Harenicola maris]